MYCSTVIVILHETKLTVASVEEEQQELLRVLEQTKRAGAYYCADLLSVSSTYNNVPQ